MLAGISHDLRTPLSRLRLEAEMSVQDDEAKASNMAIDIVQLDAIIDKFMDYARPGEVKLVPCDVATIVQREAAAFRDTSQIRIQSKVASTRASSPTTSSLAASCRTCSRTRAATAARPRPESPASSSASRAPGRG